MESPGWKITKSEILIGRFVWQLPKQTFDSKWHFNSILKFITHLQFGLFGVHRCNHLCASSNFLCRLICFSLRMHECLLAKFPFLRLAKGNWVRSKRHVTETSQTLSESLIFSIINLKILWSFRDPATMITYWCRTEPKLTFVQTDSLS